MLRLLTSFILCISFACTIANDNNGLIIKNISVIDVETGQVTPGKTIIIKGEKIDAIIDSSEEIQNDYPVIDGTDKYLIPGLIDCHVHTTAGPPPTLLEQLEKTLKSGVTLVRDMGGDVVMIKEWKEDDGLKIPTIYTSAIFAGKSWTDNDRRALMSAHRTTPGTTAWLRSIEPYDDMNAFLQEAKDFGINGIKIYADLNKETIQKITEEAKANDIPVYAHATVYPATPMEVVLSGVVSVSHSERLLTALDETVASTYHADHDNTRTYNPSVLDDKRIDQLIIAMKENNVALDATLLISKIKSARLRLKEDPRLETVYLLTKKAYHAGVTILAGTDYMITRESELANLHEELSLLVEKAGMSNLDALRAATINPSRVFKLNDMGKVKEKMLADLVLLNSNPLTKIENTSDVFLVIKNGTLLY